MSESIDNSPVWEKIKATYRASLNSMEEVKLMELHFPQFLSYQLEGLEFRIGVANQMQVEWFNQSYSKALEKAICDAGLGEGIKVIFVEDKNHKVEHPPMALQQTLIAEPKEKPVPARTKVLPSTMPLHEDYTFENFVRGPSNSFAYAAAAAVAKGLGRTVYNPLFIWGGTGLGKTHLMEAIGHKIMEKNSETSVCYITSETFLNEYVNAMVSNSLLKFRARYRKYDLLLIDDVQFIVGKKQFNEEFFNTINQLLIYEKQVVMTSDVAPKELLGLDERLISRFQQGMVVEIEQPSYETRLAILKSKMQSRHCIIPDEILNYIAENIRSHVRAIEGALSRIISFMELNQDMPLSVDIAQHLLKDMIEEEVKIKNITPDDIIQAVAEYYGVSVKDIKSASRTQSLVTPRQTAMFIASKLTTSSLNNIGKAFERTHTTVFYGSQQIQKRICVEPELKKEIENIIIKLGRKVSDVFE